MILSSPPPVAHTQLHLLERYNTVRQLTHTLCEPLQTEDYVIQSMDDVSPTKWHLAHTTWFFETFILIPHFTGYRPCHRDYAYLFNSYYVQAGDRWSRPHRGLLSRPTVAEVYAYRAYVDEQMRAFLTRADVETLGIIAPLLEIGWNHEQQHQELLLTDLKHVFSINPLYPVYRLQVQEEQHPAIPQTWVPFEGGLVEIGYGGEGFHYDNEGPRHRYFLEPFEMASRLVTNREYLAFMADGGYERPELWLSEGWATAEEKQWQAPLYWNEEDGTWWTYTLGGYRTVNLDEPVCHVSYYEADAYARWAGARLPIEHEREVVESEQAMQGNFVESARFHPAPASGAGPLLQLHGDVWEWTRSPYAPYPGYAPAPGALGEYNGKFMCNQFVLRGGSCATSITHLRPTYRNFFPASARWQFMGIRLAR